MKKMPLTQVPSLAEHFRQRHAEAIVLTDNGRAVAAVVALPNTDAETASLSTNSDFLAIIERSRRRQEREGGIWPDEMRRRLGLEKRRAGRPSARRARRSRANSG